MEPTAVETVALAGQVAHDMTMFGLFMQADLVVKAVMIGLILASLWSWTIIFDKIMRLRRLRNRADQFEEGFWSGGSLEELYDRIGGRPVDPMSAVFSSAMREWRRSQNKTDRSVARARLPDRLDRVMQVTLGREMENLEKNLGFLATVGSTAPFIGLFGTVWGIMNAFQSIAISKDTSLAVVAPGMAEALFATAIGLVAAIPAVIAYNKISSDLDRYANRLENFAGEFGAILSRQLEDRT